MKLYRILIFIYSITVLVSCQNKKWDEHYDVAEAQTTMNLWDMLQTEPKLSKFVQYAKNLHYDSILSSSNTYSVFAPTNEAFEVLQTEVDTTVLNYLISNFVIQPKTFTGTRKIQTRSKKFALLESNGTSLSFDGVKISFESPYHKNGKYFIIEKMVLPKLNLYEYYSKVNPVFQTYLKSRDSTIVDLVRSKPVGFDANGNTIYKPYVTTTINRFENDYFPIKHEYRDYNATIVFPPATDYYAALDIMAQSMGGNYTDHTSIDTAWQRTVLIPYLLKHGVFYNMLEPVDFLPKKPAPYDTVKLMNAMGDSVVIDYKVGEKTYCSNGIAYNYLDFKVPDTLYACPYTYEAEWLIKTTGTERYAWKDAVTVDADIKYLPKKTYIAPLSNPIRHLASNDSVGEVAFDLTYKGKYNIEFNVNKLFPRKYLLEIRTLYNKGGDIKVYVNDELVRSISWAEILNTQPFKSVVTGKKYSANSSGWISFDCWVNNLTEYGKCKVRLEYTPMKGVKTGNKYGVALDYFNFIPENRIK